MLPVFSIPIVLIISSELLPKSLVIFISPSPVFFTKTELSIFLLFVVVAFMVISISVSPLFSISMVFFTELFSVDVMEIGRSIWLSPVFFMIILFSTIPSLLAVILAVESCLDSDKEILLLPVLMIYILFMALPPFSA
ncbi:MAG: hypothetical protein IKW39_04585 [Alphaproteobacteria bacterium]|nr:hypothetical protein [Alphaproteobacteria bacterium]